MNQLVEYGMKALWFVAVVALINMGLMPLGYDIFTMGFMQNNIWLITLVHYAAGIAGVLGLVRFCRACMNDCADWCGSDSKKGSC